MVKNSELKSFPFVEIVWLDANSSDAWTPLNQIAKVAVCVTRGWLLHEDDNSLTVAGTLGFTEKGQVEDATGTIAIPKGMIQSRDPYPKPRKRRAVDPDGPPIDVGLRLVGK